MEHSQEAKHGAKRPSASTHQSSGNKKAPKLTPDTTTPHVDEAAKDVSLLNQDMDEDAEEVGASTRQNPDRVRLVILWVRVPKI